MGGTASFHPHYILGRALGKGGVGAVYEARDLRNGRTVAIKRLQSEDAGDRRRIEREAHALAALESPHIVRLYALEHDATGDPFLVMEALEGETLAARVARTNDETGQLVTWVRQVALGLQAAHDAGILHRDIKPANVFLARTAEGTIAKVLDFGIAKDFAESPADRTVNSGVLGTPHFMSPEQLRGHRALDARSDEYALGLLLYWLLAKQLPFADTGGDVAAYVLEVTTGRPAPIESHRDDLPWELAQAIMTALEPEPDRRHASVLELASALEPFASVTSSRSLAPVAPTPPSALASLGSERVAMVALLLALSVAVVFAVLAASARPPPVSTPNESVVAIGVTAAGLVSPSASLRSGPALAPANAPTTRALSTGAPGSSPALDQTAHPLAAKAPAAPGSSPASAAAPTPTSSPTSGATSHVREVSSARPLFL